MVARTLGVIVFFWDSGSLKEEHSFNFMEVYCAKNKKHRAVKRGIF